MSLCDVHSQLLRDTAAARGLGVLAADTPEEAWTKWAGRCQFGLSIDTFEPLLAATFRIYQWTIAAIGTEPLRLVPDRTVLTEDGVTSIPSFDPCPLCTLTAMHAERCADPTCPVTSYDGWIDEAMAEQVEIWKGFRL